MEKRIAQTSVSFNHCNVSENLPSHPGTVSITSSQLCLEILCSLKRIPSEHRGPGWRCSSCCSHDWSHIILHEHFTGLPVSMIISVNPYFQIEIILLEKVRNRNYLRCQSIKYWILIYWMYFLLVMSFYYLLNLTYVNGTSSQMVFLRCCTACYYPTAIQ